MKRYKLLFFSLLFTVGLGACFDDEGNYDYHPVNEVIIREFGDSVYYVLYLADTLRINPVVEGSAESEFSEENYDFKWLVKDSREVVGTWGTEIARTRKLEFPVDLKPGTYTLYLKVKDKKTGLLFSTFSTISVSTTLARGFLVLGDDESGNIRLDMVSMIPEQDTVVLRDLLKDSGLPKMKGAVSICHTGYYYSPDNIRLWIMGEDESYFVNGADLTGATVNSLKQMFYTSLAVPENVHPIDVFPRVNTISGRQPSSNRGMLLSDGSIVSANTIGGEFYGNPVNRLSKDPEHLLPMAPYVFYALGSFSGFMAYDKENEQILYATSSSANMSLRPDLAGDPFPWKQDEVKRTIVYGENTRNTYGGSQYGATYTLMKDVDDNYFIYCFYAYGNMYSAPRYPTKGGCWQIKKEIATDFDKASLYLFSSSRTLMYYVVGSKLYCYDYNAGNERCKSVLDDYVTTDEITYLKVDYQTASSPFNELFVGTYNSSDGGTLTKYKESTNQNILELTPVERSRWTNLCRIKSVEWRNSQD